MTQLTFTGTGAPLYRLRIRLMTLLTFSGTRSSLHGLGTKTFFDSDKSRVVVEGVWVGHTDEGAAVVATPDQRKGKHRN